MEQLTSVTLRAAGVVCTALDTPLFFTGRQHRLLTHAEALGYAAGDDPETFPQAVGCKVLEFTDAEAAVAHLRQQKLVLVYDKPMHWNGATRLCLDFRPGVWTWAWYPEAEERQRSHWRLTSYMGALMRFEWHLAENTVIAGDLPALLDRMTLDEREQTYVDSKAPEIRRWAQTCAKLALSARTT